MSHLLHSFLPKFTILGLLCHASGLFANGAAIKEIVIFDGGDLDVLRLENGMSFDKETGLLSGSGHLRTKKRYANYEIRLEMRFVDHLGWIKMNNANLPFGSRVGIESRSDVKDLQKWRTWRFAYRAMPEEARRLINLTPLDPDTPATTYTGNQGRRFHADHIAPDGGFPYDETGFVEGTARPLTMEFSSPVQIRRISLRPLDPDSPRVYLKERESAESVTLGAKVYQTYCFACHGDGVSKPPNPLARSFATDPFGNGSAPHELRKTLRTGFRNMPPMANLTDRESYAVIAYLRENILKKNNPANYFEVTKAYIDAFPEPLYSGSEQKERDAKFGNAEEKALGTYRDHGPALLSVNGEHRNAMQVKLAHDTVISYNLHDLGTNGVWHDGFMKMLGSHYYVGKGQEQPTPAGTPMPSLSTWRWAHGQTFDYETNGDYGPVPYEGFRYLGHYLHGDQAILHYQIEYRRVLERPRCDQVGEQRILRQDLKIGAGDATLQLRVGASGLSPLRDVQSDHLTILALPKSENALGIRITGDTKGITIKDAVIHIPGGAARNLTVHRVTGPRTEIGAFLSNAPRPNTDLSELTHGSSARRWAEVLTVKGSTGDRNAAYTLDTIPVPFDNPYRAWMRTTSLDFFPDGRTAVTTYDGDVWIVSGIDEDLESVTWSRFAAGLNEGFGCKVIDGLIYVVTKNGIVRLHDYDEDGEADYYEQFFADPHIARAYHGFNFDLVRDSKGYLYYAKSGQFTDIRFAGGCYRISPGGRQWEHFGTGFRTPNGLGILPDDRILFGDNQGKAVPAGKISIVEKGKWYGGADLGMETVPKTFEQPILWLPQDVDNSCGGQLWIDDSRFGPFGKGGLFHTSCGSGRAMMIYLDDLTEGTQASTQSFPWQFDSGIMRAAVNPKDGQVYVTGTRGWGVNAPKDGCLQRIRYTGKPGAVLTDVRARTGQITLSFSEALPDGEVEYCTASAWNYLWSRKVYGSKQYSVRNPGMAQPDNLTVNAVSISEDRRRITVSIPDLAPAEQVKLTYRRPGAKNREIIHLTIHHLVAPSKTIAGATAN